MQSSGTMTDEITIVENPSQPKIEVNDIEAKSDNSNSTEEEQVVINVVEEFQKSVKEHIITVIQREKPDSRGYYHMIWEEQTFAQLLEYKMLKVFKKKVDPDAPVEEPASDASAISLALEMNVREYLEELFKVLDQKLH